MLNEFRSTLITWDKATSRIYSPVTANAGDENGRKLVVQIVNSGQIEDLTGATLHLYWETRDKAHDGLDVFKAVDLKKGEFELSYTTGMLSNQGVLNANLVLIDTVGRVVSERFKITVTEGIDNDAIQSEDSFTSLTQALIDVGPRLNDLTAQLAKKAEQAALLVEKARIDSFTTLAGGSTTGDAELIDGRVGADAVTYPNIGTAIREQFDKVTSDINLYKESFYPHKYENVNGLTFPNKGYINPSGVIQDTSGTNWKYSDLIKVDVGAVMTGYIVSIGGNIVSTVAAYDATGNFMPSASVTASPVTSYTVPSGVAFIRFCKFSSYKDNYFTIKSGAYIKGLDKHISDVYEDVSMLKSGKNKINLMMIGDSYGIQNLDGNITKFYWEFVRDALDLTEGVNFWHQYRVGAGFGNNGYREQLELITSIPDKEAITDILVCGGWNDSNSALDYGTDEAFASGILDFDSYVKTNYPNARVSVGYISWASYADSGVHTQMALAIKRYKEACNLYGWRYLVNTEYIMHDYTPTLWQSDNAHPNGNGQTLLGKNLSSAFLSGSTDVFKVSEESGLTAYGWASANSDFNFCSEVTNGITRLWTNSPTGYSRLTSLQRINWVCDGSESYNVGKISDKHFRGFGKYTKVRTDCIIVTSAGMHYGSALIEIDGQLFNIRLFVPNNNALGNITNVTAIYLATFQMTVPTIRA